MWNERRLRNRLRGVSLVWASCLAVLGTSQAYAQGISVEWKWSPTPEAVVSNVSSSQIATGFAKPVFCTSPKGDANRLFVVEQDGTIQILNLHTGARTTFLNISTLVAKGGERGLLGLAFHPSYAKTRKFYVYYTGIAAGETRVVEYHASAADPNRADPGSARLLLTFAQPQANHNGGWIGFGFDNCLYIASGDGGGANDSAVGHTEGIGNAQDITDNLLGKILRIIIHGDSYPTDPNRNYTIPASNPFVGKEGDDEIWAFGLRNPWRCSFDRGTGHFLIADVGQAHREEINFQPKTAPGGRNYGWRVREGKIANTAFPDDPRPAKAIDPLYDYAHGTAAFQGNSVTGGYVYRGPIAALQGKYFFGDYVRGQIWSFEFGSTGGMLNRTDWTTALQPDVGAINKVSSFGEDDAGNLYIVDYDGELYRIVETSSTLPLETLIPPFVRGVMSTQSMQ